MHSRRMTNPIDEAEYDQYEDNMADDGNTGDPLLPGARAKRSVNGGTSKKEKQGCFAGLVDFIKGITWQTWLRLGALALVLAIIFGTLFVLRNYISKWLTELLGYVADLGVWGPIILAGIYVVATVCFVPGLILTVGAGFFFGLFYGLIAVSVGSVIGACCAFLLGRFLFRGWVEARIAQYPIFHAVDLAIGKRGWLIVLLIRLSPVLPFNIVNYALGVTGVGFWTYALTSWVGMIPGTLLYVYLGFAVRQISSNFTGDTSGVGGYTTEIFFGVGLVVTLVCVVCVTIIAKQAISKALLEAELSEKVQNGELDGDLVRVYLALDPRPADSEVFVTDIGVYQREGVASYVDEEGPKSAYVFLSDGHLLITIPSDDRGNDETTYWLRVQICLSNGVTPAKRNATEVVLACSTNNKQYTLLFKDGYERDNWFNSVQQAISRAGRPSSVR